MMKDRILIIVVSILTSIGLTMYYTPQLSAQSIKAEPPMDSEWYYDYHYGTTAEKDAEPPCGYTKITTVGKSVRHDKEVVEYEMTHVTKFGSTTEPPYYVYYDGAKAYLQRENGTLSLLYDLSKETGEDILTSSLPLEDFTYSPLRIQVLSREEQEINGKRYIVQEYKHTNAVILHGADTIPNYTVTQHIGFSHLEALLLSGRHTFSHLFALQGGRLRSYHGGGVSYIPEGATTPYDAVKDDNLSFTDHPLIKGSLWYVRGTIDAATNRERYYTNVYHMTGEVVNQDGKEYHKMERYFSLDGPDTPHKRYFYLRYDAQQGVEYISGMGYDQGKPGDNEKVLYDYKTLLGASAMHKGVSSIVDRECVLPFVSTLEIEDQERRRFRYQSYRNDPYGFVYSYIWIEGVGWDQGFFPYPPGILGGEPDKLIYAEDKEGRTYGVKKFINTGIDAPTSVRSDEPPFIVSSDGAELRVRTSSLAGFMDQSLTLYDPTGAVVLTEELSSSDQDLILDSSLPAGIYFWQIRDAVGGNSYSSKLIVP